MAKSKYQIRITGCNDNLLWYSKRIGEIFPLMEAYVGEGYYKTRVDDNRYINFVKFEDCILEKISEEPEKINPLLTKEIREYIEQEVSRQLSLNSGPFGKVW